MSRQRVTIQFYSLHQLWQFAQQIKANNIEIKTRECLLICDCSDEDLQLLEKYNGKRIGQLVER